MALIDRIERAADDVAVLSVTLADGNKLPEGGTIDQVERGFTLFYGLWGSLVLLVTLVSALFGTAVLAVVGTLGVLWLLLLAAGGTRVEKKIRAVNR